MHFKKEYGIALIAISLAWISPTRAESCPPVATLESFQGIIEGKVAGAPQWVKSKQGESYCKGDSLRSNRKSRVAIRLTNDTLIRLDQNSTVTFTDIQKEKKSLLELIKGSLHMMSRTPRPLEIKTPFVNAAIEGTEFVITAGQNASNITVYEGKVRATNAQGSVTLKPNESGRIESNSKPAKILTARPRDAIAWALHYPPILDSASLKYETCPSVSKLRAALNQLSKRNPGKSRSILEQIPQTDHLSTYHLIAASTDLAVGDLAAAKQHLEAVSGSESKQAAANSLQAIIEIVQNNLAGAASKTDQALTRAPDSPLAHTANSYLQQARFNIPAALSAAQKAVELAPRSANAHARLAEVLLMNGETATAQALAKQAIKLNPALSHNQTVLGFASLKNLNQKNAVAAFNRAIELDASAPLPHLGLGLNQIRENRLKKGRESIELAALLDPSNSLLRAYLGKAYYEETRSGLAEEQFKLAKNLDKNDPTAWFYHSILLQSINRPIDALDNQQQAIKLNDNRGVYRSRQLLDQDEAARTVSLGRIYNDLGFEQLSARQATDALAMDPGNHSAHRLLADSYHGRSDLDGARLSELLQAQILQPLNLTPIPPQLASSNLGLLDGAGPGSLSYNEFNPMFTREGVFSQFNGLAGGQGTWGNDAVIAGLNNRSAYSIGQYHFETDGAGINQNFEKDIYNLFVQGKPAEDTSIQFEIKREEETKGDVAQRFFAEALNDPDIQIDQKTTSYRLGLAQDLSRHSKILASAIWKDREAETVNPSLFPQPNSTPLPADLVTSIQKDTGLLDLQHVLSAEKLSLISGLIYHKDRRVRSLKFDFSPAPCLFPAPNCVVLTSDSTDKKTKIYSYFNYQIDTDFELESGVSLEKVTPETAGLDKNHTLPKLGINWKASDRTKLSAAAFRTASQIITASQFQTLEATQVAGFNQLFDEPANSTTWNYGVRMDNQFSPDISWGASSVFRDGEIAVAVADISETNPVFKYQDIESSRYLSNLYFNYTINSNLAISAEYSRNKFELNKLLTLNSGSTGLAPGGILSLDTHQLPISLRYLHPSGFGVIAQTTFYDQKGDFIDTKEGSTIQHGADRFWITDLTASYRLSKRRGSVALGIKNLFDESFQFEDISTHDELSVLPSATPSAISNERLLFGRISLHFR